MVPEPARRDFWGKSQEQVEKSPSPTCRCRWHVLGNHRISNTCAPPLFQVDFYRLSPNLPHMELSTQLWVLFTRVAARERDWRSWWSSLICLSCPFFLLKPILIGILSSLGLYWCQIDSSPWSSNSSNPVSWFYSISGIHCLGKSFPDSLPASILQLRNQHRSNTQSQSDMPWCFLCNYVTQLTSFNHHQDSEWIHQHKVTFIPIPNPCKLFMYCPHLMLLLWEYYLFPHPIQVSEFPPSCCYWHTSISGFFFVVIYNSLEWMFFIAD